MAYGAGLDVLGDVTLKNSIVTGNTATNGVVPGAYYPNVFDGGIYAAGVVRVKYGSEVSNNLASAQSGYVHGGGIHAVGGVSVFDASITGNRAEAVGTGTGAGFAYGGGFNVVNGPASLFLGKVQDNTAYSRERSVYGGGLNTFGDYANGTGADFQFSTISGNTAHSECGFCFILGGGASSFGPVKVKYSTVDNNTAVLSAEGNHGTSVGGGIGIYTDNLELVVHHSVCTLV